MVNNLEYILIILYFRHMCSLGESDSTRHLVFFSTYFVPWTESHQGPFHSLTFPQVLRDWVIKGLGMSSLVCATGHIKDPVPLIEKRRGCLPVVGFLLVSFIK